MPDDRILVSRREFLLLSSAGTIVANDPLLGREVGAELPTHRFKIRRDRDLLSLEISFVNFDRRDDTLRSLGAGRSLVIVKLPPQNLAEARFDKTAKDPAAPTGLPASPGSDPEYEVEPLETFSRNLYSAKAPVACYMSGPSWVVFNAPDSTEIPLTLKAMKLHRAACGVQRFSNSSVVDFWLDHIGSWPIRVPRNAVTPGRPDMPARDETCLEIPFRLFISPKSRTAKWITSSSPPMRFVGQRPHAVELWHAALHDREKLLPGKPPSDAANIPQELAPPKRVTSQLRAVFSPDYQREGEPPEWGKFYPGNLPLSHRSLARHLLVKQMTEGTGDGWIDAEHLVLSSLGASTSLSYYMEKTFREIHDKQLNQTPTEIENDGKVLAVWKHRMIVGRDEFLLNAWVGFMLPFTFPALLIELTRRSFVARKRENNDNSVGPPGAFLLTEYYILIQDPVKQFPSNNCPIALKNPIKKVTVLSTRSPLIRPPSDNDMKNGFVPKNLAGGAFVRWPIEFEDGSGNRSRTEDACLVFSHNIFRGKDVWDNSSDEITRWKMPAQRIEMAPSTAHLETGAIGQESNKVHALTKSETGALSKIAIELRNALTDPQQLPNVVNKLKNFGLQSSPSSPLQEAIDSLRPETQKFIRESLAGTLPSDASIADPLERVFRQFSRAEQAATDVEVHAIQFSCRDVNSVFRSLDDLTSLLSRAASKAQFLADIDSVVGMAGEAKTTLKLEIESLWGDIIDWKVAKSRSLTFLEELKRESDVAKDFFRHGLQPQLRTADVIAPALKALGNESGPQRFSLYDGFTSKGIADVKNSVFGQFDSAIEDGQSMANRVQCAVASPSMSIAGLSRDLGGLAGKCPNDIKNLAMQEAGIDIGSAIPDFKLLGVLKIQQLLGPLTSAELPTITLLNKPDRIEHIWEWNAPLKQSDFAIISFDPDVRKKGVSTSSSGSGSSTPKSPVHVYIRMTTTIDTPSGEQAIQGQRPVGHVRMDGAVAYWNKVAKKPILDDSDDRFAFGIGVLKLIDIKFSYVTFEADYNVGDLPKPKLKPRLGVIEFRPPLDFVSKLQSLLPVLGDGFTIVQSPGRIGIRYSFLVPSIAFGAFSMRNLSIGCAVMFSLEGKPLRFDFNFSSWVQPFELTVMCFGGRGFLKIAADTEGYRDLQGMIEFGGSLAFDVVVASGGLYVMAGIYFRITPESTTIAAFLRAGGSLYVVGLIHASVEFVLMLSYVESSSSKPKLAGEATVTVSIDLFLVSFDVSITMYKEFMGGDDDSGSSSTASLDQTPEKRTRLISFLQPTPSSGEYSIPKAYLDRNAGALKTKGRFRSAQQWNSDYWSKFAL